MTTYIICGRPKCCPEVNVEADKTTIKDDYNGEVTFTAQQWEDLITRAKAGEFDNE